MTMTRHSDNDLGHLAATDATVFGDSPVADLILSTQRGARDMLREAAKQFRLGGDSGHATMCDLHANAVETALAALVPGNAEQRADSSLQLNTGASRWHWVGGVSSGEGYSAHLLAPDGRQYAISRRDAPLGDGNSPEMVAEREAELRAIRRMVACANACSAMPTSALEAGDLQQALEKGASALRDLDNDWSKRELVEPVKEILARFQRLGIGDDAPVNEDEPEGPRP